MAGDILYTAENEQPADNLDKFMEWYAWRHVPDVYRLGFLTCASYRAVEGGFNVLGIYELKSVGIFHTPGYKNVQPKDHYQPPIAARITARAHTTYRQRPLYPARSTEEMEGLDADWLALLRFAASPDTEEAIIRWFRDDGGRKGFDSSARAMRIAHRDGERPASVTHRPRCIIAAECDTRPPPGAQFWEPLQRRFGSAVTDADFYVGRRVYPWPDRPYQC
jgi:hypothetical protein